ncbi:MAG: ASPIC/UnbV domain-containing protein, partial [Acidimicrobiales bacterium]
AAADYDNDGDVDVAVGTIGGRLALLRNTGSGGHWLTVAPDPALPGTVVTVRADGTNQRREVVAGSSYLSSEDPRLHFGLGATATGVSVRVRWPDGLEWAVDDPAVDQILTISRDDANIES